MSSPKTPESTAPALQSAEFRGLSLHLRTQDQRPDDSGGQDLRDQIHEALAKALRTAGARLSQDSPNRLDVTLERVAANGRTGAGEQCSLLTGILTLARAEQPLEITIRTCTPKGAEDVGRQLRRSVGALIGQLDVAVADPAHYGELSGTPERSASRGAPVPASPRVVRPRLMGPAERVRPRAERTETPPPPPFQPAEEPEYEYEEAPAPALEEEPPLDDEPLVEPLEEPQVAPIPI